MLNHSNDPNIRLFIKDYGDGYGYALRDIEEGEELTEDYRNYSFVPFLFRLMQEHGVRRFCHQITVSMIVMS